MKCWAGCTSWNQDCRKKYQQPQICRWHHLYGRNFPPWKEIYDQPREQTEKQRHYFANKGLSSEGYGFSSGHAWMWELDYKESWALKNWCFWTVLLKTLESPLDCNEIQPVHPKGDQFWTFIGRIDAEAETPILWPPDAKRWLIWKDPDAGKDWEQEEKVTTEDEMVGWHQAWHSVVRGVAKNRTRMSNWTELNDSKVFFPYPSQRGYLIWATDYYI